MLNIPPSLLPKLYCVPCGGTGGQGMGAMVSSSPVISAVDQNSPLPQSKVSGDSSPCTAAKWLSLAQGTVLQVQPASLWVPHRVTSPARKSVPTQVSHGFTASSQHPPAAGLPGLCSVLSAATRIMY